MKPMNAEGFMWAILYLVLSSRIATASLSLGCKPTPVSNNVYNLLNSVSKLVSISYCVGREGIQVPFSCLNHCSEFPKLELLQTWDTGILYNTCGYIAVQKDKKDKPWVFVVFRGTSSFSNLVSDLRAYPAQYTPYQGQRDMDCTNCTVHKGFLSAWNAARGMIVPQLKALLAENPNYRLMLAGHSFGGAVAGLAGTELAAEGIWNSIHVITFGEPMFANDHMASYVNRAFNNTRSTVRGDHHTYWRVTNTGDPVPDLPPRTWGWQGHDQQISIEGKSLVPAKEDVVSCGNLSAQRHVSTDITDVLVHSERNLTASNPNQSKPILIMQTPELEKSSGVGWTSIFAHGEYFTRMGLCFDPDWAAQVDLSLAT